MSPDIIAAVTERFPRISSISRTASAAVFRNARMTRLSAGKQFVDVFAPCPVLFFLLSGEKRIYYLDESGKEVTLFFVQPGQHCTLNILAVLSEKPFPAQLEVLCDSLFVTIPAEDVRTWARTEADVSRYFFDVIYHDSDSLLRLLAQLAFRPVSRRLREYLFERAENGVVHATHQRIANDLGTSREVITRLLKEFALEGAVRTSRGEIELQPGLQSSLAEA